MWFYYALFFALWGGLGALIAKGKFKNVSAVTVPFFVLLFTVPSIIVILLFTGGFPRVTPSYFLYVFMAGLLDSIAFTLAFLAIKKTDISIIAPMSSFAPMLTTLFAIFALGEIPSVPKLGGIALVVIGAYLLNLAEVRKGILSPFKKLFSNQGVIYFLMANLLWSITPIFQKKAIFETTPETPLFASFGGLTTAMLILAPFAIRKALKDVKSVKKIIHWFAIYGVGASFAQLAAYTAFALANVGYVSSVMRLESIVTIIFGGKILKEKGMRQKLLGAIVMIAGALIIAS